VRPLSILAQTRNLLRFARGKARPCRGPAKVSWEVINSCDSRCRTCQRWTEEESPGRLSTEEGKSLIEDVARLGALAFSFTGGEPFLREDLLELVRHASSLGLSTHISTNALSFDEERVRGVCASGLTTLSVSLDGPTAELNDDLRGVKGYFDKGLEVLRAVRKERDETGKGPALLVNVTVSSANAADLSLFATLVREVGADSLTFQPVHHFGDILLGTSKNLRLDDSQEDRVARAIKDVCRDHGDLVPLPQAFLDGMVAFGRDPKSLYKIPCVAGYLFAQIDTDGNVFPCPIKFASMGNVREQSFREIWFGRKSQDVRRRIRENDHPICWMNCIAPMSVLAQDVRRLRIGAFLGRSVRRHVLRRLRGGP
jgi:MoaA/NifB/PqqE/SkfB family radical SAM enzyme